ncbi:substrate-binding periplasmic protein [Alteromonas gilva]|uniref:Transporter substrate-binding domain-containing protein n=1 Tax=Alteromonas gilva TaxID=2987522 RepID=A0ABT5L8T2_9ALTE|nr:transporter substrate-binding domain-containing protein [Alteromonas gilva]MDC8832387.1 transporter substrate-binding domain-containing protein [Alteromonas gilva]
MINMVWVGKFRQAGKLGSLLLCSLWGFQCIAQSPLKLVANPLPTMVAEEPGAPSARLNQLITNAFAAINVDVLLETDRPAFSGSGLLTGRYDGEYAHFNLQDRRDNLLFSKTYLPSHLYLASREHTLDEVSQFSHIPNSRVATTNSIANSTELRRVKAVSWARNPTVLDMFKQLSEGRADYALEDGLILAEFNRLLADSAEQPLFLSPKPLITSGFTLSIRKDYPNAQQILNDFDAYIATIQKDGRFNKIMAITWTSKDINADGTADWITTADAHHEGPAPMSLKEVVPLDKTPTGTASLFYIDGKAYPDWQSAQQALSNTRALPRPSLLDHEVYKGMLKRW